MARKDDNPSQGRGKPTTQVGFEKQFVSPFNAQGSSKSWPTIPADLVKKRTPRDPLGVAPSVSTGRKGGN